MITVYTDGSSLGNPGPAGWAILIDDVLHSGYLMHDATNNQMELYAIYQAVVHCPAHCDLHIITDSKLAIGWLSRGWRINYPHIQSIVKAIFDVVQAKSVGMTFEKIAAHKGHPGNTRVDRAACAQATLAKTQVPFQRVKAQCQA